MDRLRRVLTGGTLVLIAGTVIASSGCRSLRSEVPPGPRYSTTGGTPPLGFNQEPRPNTMAGSGFYGNSATPGQPGMPGGDPTGAGLGSSPAQLGTPAPSSGLYGVTPGVGRSAPSMTPGTPGSDTGR
jgi:hypothetical protein